MNRYIIWRDISTQEVQHVRILLSSAKRTTKGWFDGLTVKGEYSGRLVGESVL